MKKTSKQPSKQSKILWAILLIMAVVACSYLFGGENLFSSEGDTSTYEPDLSYNSEETEESSTETTAPQTAAPSATSSKATTTNATTAKTGKTIDKDGIYTTKADVALYIHTYNKLPSNFIKKADAEKLGWSGGGLDKYAKNKCIGGDRFGNYEGILPKKQGRTYTECDIDTLGAKSRGAKRIVFSNDGLIYYTEDHYETFELLYGEE